MINQIYNSLGRFAEDDENGHLQATVEILAAPLDRIFTVIGESTEGDPGFSIVFDMDRAPTGVLPWTAQFVGSTITPAMDRAAAIAAITNPDVFGVGKLTSMVSAAKRTLTGAKRVIVHIHNPSEGHVYIRTISTETSSETATEAAIRSQMPWYLVLNYAAATGLTYIDVDTNFDTYADLEAANLTYGELAETLP